MATNHAHDEDVVLCALCTGSWLLTTESGSMHLLDLDAATVTRVPDPEALQEWLDAGHRRPDRDEIVTGLTLTPAEVAMLAAGGLPATALRGDGEATALHGFSPVRIGEPARLAVQAHSDPSVVTTRITSPVVDVREVES